jgi:uncharacterized membrane protein (UPF0136 family)
VEHTEPLEDAGAPAVVGIAAMIGVAKAAFEGLFGIIGVAAADSIHDGFGLGAIVFAVLYVLSAWLMLRGNKVGLYITVALSALGLIAAIVYLFRAEDAVFGAVLVIAGLNALVLYLLLGTKSARAWFAR